MGFCKQILIAYSPGGGEGGIFVILLLHHLVGAVIEEVGAHIVKMTFAAVNEGGVVAQIFIDLHERGHG